MQKVKAKSKAPPPTTAERLASFLAEDLASLSSPPKTLPDRAVRHQRSGPTAAKTGALISHRFVIEVEAAAAEEVAARYDGRAGSLNSVFRPAFPAMTFERAGVELVELGEVMSSGEDGASEERRAVELELWIWE